MALARIITRSQTCSRELALVLRARGYAVEIVSPDKVPDNIADLELRVDAGPANDLIANVEAHDGERTTSLEFVHHLKAPVADFDRRASALGEAAHLFGAPVSFKTGPGIEELGLSAKGPRPASRVVSPAPETLSHGEPNPSGGLRLIAPQALLRLEEFPGYVKVEDAAVRQPALIRPALIQQITTQQTTIQQTVIQQVTTAPTQVAKPRNRSMGWPWRAGLAFASMVLLAIVLGVGVRPGRRAAAPGSETLPVGGIVGPTGANQPSALGAEKDLTKTQEQISAVTWGLSAADSEANSSHAAEEAQAPKSGTLTTGPKSAISRKRGEDLIARDTTIYFDKRFEPDPKTKRARPISHRRVNQGESH